MIPKKLQTSNKKQIDKKCSHQLKKNHFYNIRTKNKLHTFFTFIYSKIFFFKLIFIFSIIQKDSIISRETPQKIEFLDLQLYLLILKDLYQKIILQVYFKKMKKHIQIFKLENEFEKSLSKYQSSYLNTPSNQKNQKNSFFIKNNLFTNSCLKNIVSFEDIDKIKLYRNQSKFHSNRVFKGYNNKYHKNNKQYLRKLPVTKKLIAITENKEIIYKHIFQKTMMGKQQENYSRNNSIMYILSHTIAQGRQFTELSYPNKFNNQRKQLQSLETSTF